MRNQYTRAILQATENSFHRHDKPFYHLKTFYTAAQAKKKSGTSTKCWKPKIKAWRERRRKERVEMSLPWPYLRNIPVKTLELFPRFASVSLSWGEKSPIKGKRHTYPVLYKGQVFLQSSESINFRFSTQQARKATKTLKLKNILSCFHLHKYETRGR